MNHAHDRGPDCRTDERQHEVSLVLSHLAAESALLAALNRAKRAEAMLAMHLRRNGKTIIHNGLVYYLDLNAETVKCKPTNKSPIGALRSLLFPCKPG